MFHAIKDWYFRRLPNGNVVIAHYPMGIEESAMPTAAVNIPADIWEKVIVSLETPFPQPPPADALAKE